MYHSYARPWRSTGIVCRQKGKTPQALNRRSLLGLLVLGVRVAEPAILLESKLLGGSPLVLGRIIVAALALGAGQSN